MASPGSVHPLGGTAGAQGHPELESRGDMGKVRILTVLNKIQLLFLETTMKNQNTEQLTCLEDFA